MATDSDKNLPPGYPSGEEAEFTTRNGRTVFLRPIKPSDRELLVDLFHRLSERSIYLRFLGHLRELTPDLLDRFTLVNYLSDFALAATIRESDGEHIIAVSRYHLNGDTWATEFAVAVRDDWQGAGLGKEMLRRLFDAARRNGLRQLEAVMDSSNDAIPKILKALGHPYKATPLRGLYALEVDL